MGLYDPINKKIIILRDVEFLENQSWDDSIDEPSSTSIKVPTIEEEEDDIGDQQEDEAKKWIVDKDRKVSNP